MFHDVFVFSEHNARRLKVSDLTPFIGMKNVAIDPDLTELLNKGVKPHHWKLVDGVVVKKSEAEMGATDVWFRSKASKIPPPKARVKEVIKEVIKEVPIEVIKYIDREVAVDRVVEKEVSLEINVDKKVIEYKVPKWSLYLHVALSVTCAILLWRLSVS